MDHYREPTFGGFPRAAHAVPPSPPATIKGMIERFRHGEPLPRAERERIREESGQSPEFWWRASDPGVASKAHDASAYHAHQHKDAFHAQQHGDGNDRFGPAAQGGIAWNIDTRYVGNQRVVVLHLPRSDSNHFLDPPATMAGRGHMAIKTRCLPVGIPGRLPLPLLGGMRIIHSSTTAPVMNFSCSTLTLLILQAIERCPDFLLPRLL